MAGAKNKKKNNLSSAISFLLVNYIFLLAFCLIPTSVPHSHSVCNLEILHGRGYSNYLLNAVSSAMACTSCCVLQKVLMECLILPWKPFRFEWQPVCPPRWDVLTFSTLHLQQDCPVEGDTPAPHTPPTAPALLCPHGNGRSARGPRGGKRDSS